MQPNRADAVPAAGLPADPTAALIPDDLVTALLGASRAMVGIALRAMSAPDGGDGAVTLPQYRALALLGGRDGGSLTALAHDLGVNTSTAQRMVERLVASGHVSREPDADDRRRVRLALTGDGAALLERVTARRRAEIERVVDALPEAERASLTGALPGIAAFAEAAGAPPADDDRQLL